nr:uncharacterized protein LOC129445857 [Misgurnus anguillicaudatus]
MGLPGKPTFTDLRTSIATHARNTHSSSNRTKVAKFMCHDTFTADKFYAMNLSAKQAVEHRRLFEEALCGEEVSPAKPSEEGTSRKRVAKTKHGGWKRRREESPPTSPSSSSLEVGETVTFQESGVSSIDSPSSLEEYPRTQGLASPPSPHPRTLRGKADVSLLRKSALRPGRPRAGRPRAAARLSPYYGPAARLSPTDSPGARANLRRATEATGKKKKKAL